MRGDIAVGDTVLLAYLDVYFDAATGDNCAITTTTGPVTGKAAWIIVELAKCKETKPGTTCTVLTKDRDPNSGTGNFHTYAGPVTVNAPKNCIRYTSQLAVPVEGDHSLAYYSSGAVHC
ncbi:MAG: hypothetical protein QG608_2371 [Actinomycetota bacterium]|nr:hypothetical protein [Actinomycetota bacterium]